MALARHPGDAKTSDVSASPSEMHAAPVRISGQPSGTVVHSPPEPARAAPANSFINVATSLIAAAVAPFFAPEPAQPTQAPLLYGLLGWVRREIQRTFFNRTPDIRPQELTLELGDPDDVSDPIPFNATDGDHDTLTYVVPDRGQPGGPTHGTVTVDQATGTFTYDPDDAIAQQGGTDAFTVTVSDQSSGFHLHGPFGFLLPGRGHTDTATVTIAVMPVNDAPVAVDRTVDVGEDGQVGAGLGISDPDGDPLSFTVVTEAAHGSVVLSAGPSGDGSFTYTPAPDFSGTDSFTYRVSDGTLSDEATVTIIVHPSPDYPVAGDDTYTTAEDTALIVGAGGVLSNDSDADGEALSVTVQTNPTGGTVTLNGDGSFTYVPTKDFAGTDMFTYTVTDPTNRTDTATVTIAVMPVNDAPVAVGDAFTTAEDSALSDNVLGNDTDGDGDLLTVADYTQPANGSVVLQPDGSFTYTPNADFHGADDFVYTVTDGTTINQALVAITVTPVNDAPVAVDDTYSTTKGTPVTLDVLANDTDADGDDLLNGGISYSPENGEVRVNPDGTLTYTPAANFLGTNIVTYIVTDGRGGSDTANITITVAPPPPVAEPDAYTIAEDTTLTVSAPGVLVNDLDPDGDPLTAALVTGPANGTLAFNDDGSFTYTPNRDFTGADHFTYTASDTGTTSSAVPVTVTVTPVNDRPVALHDEFRTLQDAPLTITQQQILANDIDPDGDRLSVVIISGPFNGSVSSDSAGNWIYYPYTGFVGTDFINYIVWDGTVGSNQNFVAISVAPPTSAAPEEPSRSENRSATTTPLLR